MSDKGKYWLRLGLFSIFFGGPLALALLPFWSEGPSRGQDCTLFNFFWLSVIFTAACFGGIIVVVFLGWLLKPFFRWLFTLRIIKRCLFAFLFLLALVPIFYAEENWRGRRAWENYKHELEARGEKLDFASYIPAPVPDDQNFAFAPLVQTAWDCVLNTNENKLTQPLTNIARPLDMKIDRTRHFSDDFGTPPPADWRMGIPADLAARQKYYRTRFLTNVIPANLFRPMQEADDASVSTNHLNPADTNEMINIITLPTDEFPVAAQPQTPSADVLLALSKYDATLKNLADAAKRPKSRFPLNYEVAAPWEILTPHHSQLANCMRVLSLRASAELDGTNAGSSLADIKLILRLLDSVHDEPFEYAQVARAGWLHHAMQPIWEGVWPFSAGMTGNWPIWMPVWPVLISSPVTFLACGENSR